MDSSAAARVMAAAQTLVAAEGVRVPAVARVHPRALAARGPAKVPVALARPRVLVARGPAKVLVALARPKDLVAITQPPFPAPEAAEVPQTVAHAMGAFAMTEAIQRPSSRISGQDEVGEMW